MLVLSLAPLLAKQYDVLVAGLYDSDDPRGEQELRHRLEAAGVETFCIGKRTGSKRLSATIRLQRLLRHWNPDILHTHCYLANFYGRLSAAFAGVNKIIVTHHSGDNEWRDRRYWLEKSVQPLTSCHVAVSPHISEVLVHTLHVHPSKIRVIPNGIEIQRFVEGRQRREDVRAKLGLKPSDIVLLNLAHIDRAKGQAYLMKAFADLVQDFPTLRLLIAGQVREDQLSTQLQSLVVETKVAEQVRFLGSVQDVPGLLAAGDFFVMPSLIEGHPVALLEAMAARIPVVATAVPGIEAIAIADVEAILVQPANPDSLAQGIRRALNSRELCSKITAAAFKKVSENFGIEGIASAYSALYEDLLGNSLEVNREEQVAQRGV